MPNRILQLINDNRQSPRRFEVVASGSGDEATIFLYDVIVSDDWYGGVSPQTFVQQLAQISAPTIHLRINSPGGDVFSARAMEQAIREHASTVVAHVDGVAASAASFLAIACDKVVIAEGGFFMIHNASALAYGNGGDLRATADLLDKVDATLVTSYANKTGQTAEDIAAWMDAETWFTSAEAVEKGFADEVASGSAPSNAAGWNLSAYSNAPKVPDAPKIPCSDPAAQQPAAVAPVVPPPAAPPKIDFAAMRRRLALSTTL